MIRRPRLSLVFLLLVVGCVGGFFVYKYFHSTQNITISFVNSHELKLYDTSPSTASEDKKLVSGISQPNQKLRLYKNRSYLVEYKGDPGFADGQDNFRVSSKITEVKINPYFSAEKLAGMLVSEQKSIGSALQESYPKVSLYKIQFGKLYHWGDWYGTTLKYKGDYSFNSDSLRVVLHKQNGVWTVSSNPPSITLDKYTFPDIPVDVLRDVNSFKVELFESSGQSSGTHLRL